MNILETSINMQTHPRVHQKFIYEAHLPQNGKVSISLRRGIESDSAFELLQKPLSENVYVTLRTQQPLKAMERSG